MIQRLTKALLPGEIPLTDTTVHFVDTFDDVLEFRTWLSNSRGRTILAVDTETTGLSPYVDDARIRLAQFGDENEAWVINCEKWAGVAREVIETYDDTPMVFHNLAFDYTYMMEMWPDLQFPWHLMHDTMLYMRLHDNEGVAGLKPVSKNLFGPAAVVGQDALTESMRVNGWSWKTVPMTSPAYTLYSGVDVILTARLYRRLEHIYTGPMAEMAEMEMQALRVTCNMSRKGMHIDRDYCIEKRATLRGYVDTVTDTLKTHMGINVRSSAQLADYFIREGATLTAKTAKGAWQMDKDALNRLAADGYKVAHAILDMRKADKLATTYFDNLLDYSDNPQHLIHPQINTIAARTGRMSVTSPALQTLPSKDSLIRGAFVPVPGEKMVSCDFSQIELRLTAHLSQDPALIAAFADCDATGDDFFTRVGRDIYGNTFTKEDLRRTLIKNVIYGSTYGAGVAKMAESAKVPLAIMQPIADDIFRRFVGVKGIQEMASLEAQHNERSYGRPFITSQSGRRLYVDPDRIYSAANYTVQSLAADLMKQALIRLDNAGLGPYMLLPIHDECVFSVPDEFVGDVMPIIQETMSITTEMGFTVPVPAEPEGPWDRWKGKA